MASFITIEYGFVIEFTQETLYLLKDIHNISGQNIILINDLFSYRKEFYEILVNNDDKNIRKYLNGLSDLIIGNLHWSCISPRYHGIDQLFNYFQKR